MNMLYSTGEFPLELLHSEMVAFFFSQEADETKTTTQSASTTLQRHPFGPTNAATKLEALGYRVGWAMAERLAREHPRFITELDCLKFLCKDFWATAFTKQVDNLRTNHQGVYVIQDNRFWLLSAFPPSPDCRHDAAKFLAYPCGLLRGALANLAITALVTAQLEGPPSVKFNITVQSK